MAYIGGYVFQDDVLQFIGNEEGRARPKDNGFVFDYFIKDHLGNTRMVLTDEQQTDAYPVASMETANADSEKLYYSNIDETRSDKPAGYPEDTYTNPNEKVAKLNSSSKKIGPAILLKVMSGDQMNIRANAYYRLNVTSVGSPSNPASELLAALAGSIQGVTGGKFGLQQVQSSGVLGPGISDLLQRQTDQYVGSNRPKAFLNWILLDEQFKIVNSSSGFEQVGPDDQLKIFLKTGLPISQNGYLYVYTSNESPVDVFFDNLQVSHVRGPLLEETHYYPFGLAMSGISSKAAGKLENMMKFNGGNELQSKEFSNGGGLELYDANFRTYDPQIGRFHQQDPLADVLEDESPYSFASNNPILYNDPLGLAKTDDNTLPEVVVTVVRRKKATPPPQAPQTIPAGATPLPLTPSPLTPVPPQAPVVPINTPPSTNPIPVIVETGAGLLSRFLGVIGGLLIPTPTGAGADKVPHPFAPDPFPGHGNRRDNSNPHIVYKFTFAPKDGKTPVLKYGISDVYRNGFNRPEGQLAAFKAIYGQTVTMQVLTRTVNRAAALFIEAGLVGKHVSQWGVMPREQKRPGGF